MANSKADTHFDSDSETDFAARGRLNQQERMAELKRALWLHRMRIGSSGSVVARRLAQIPDVSVLPLEASGTDDVLNVMQAIQWSTNLGSERDWGFCLQLFDLSGKVAVVTGGNGGIRRGIPPPGPEPGRPLQS